ncbi:hypothetical protein Mvan_3866 [Mycolicibacterium vanbaalenii PYR-1]|uniref:Uncharacterized protein n=1 Tax=Mycolicibacterium vanbaalenii (strain DSM 7251 / JCM 13017 / BCRC 16820 / KCTC 9966 / NRRL B-24157 / PYR-1) TaxID=350058 RepID=A1TBU7_MYCVP|nr:hypothetical protein Mvan_3866 [Mycolicibacterium vanbaalenii PYR-1]
MQQWIQFDRGRRRGKAPQRDTGIRRPDPVVNRRNANRRLRDVRHSPGHRSRHPADRFDHRSGSTRHRRIDDRRQQPGRTHRHRSGRGVRAAMLLSWRRGPLKCVVGQAS